MSELGFCVTSIAGPNGVRNCTRDEGGPFGFGNQVSISSHRKLLSPKAMVVSIAENVGTTIPSGTVERGERKRTAAEASKSDVETRDVEALGAQLDIAVGRAQD